MQKIRKKQNGWSLANSNRMAEEARKNVHKIIPLLLKREVGKNIVRLVDSI